MFTKSVRNHRHLHTNVINGKTENCHIGVNAQASGWHVPHSWWRQCTWRYLRSISHLLSMTESPREDPIPVVCSDLSISAWYGTALPRQDTSVDHWSRCSVSTQIGEYVDTHRVVNSPIHTRRLGISNGGRTCLNTLPASVRSTPSLAGFRQQLKTTLFQVSGFLPKTSVQCPCNSLLLKHHYNNVHSLIHSFIHDR